MKRILFLLLAVTVMGTAAQAQKYFTKNGKISFFSKATLENIQADNNQVISVIDAGTGEIQFSLLNNAFHFEKALMEEHFNDDYMESAKYPKSTFKGMISNISTVNFTADGTYAVSVTGDLSIHGRTKTITAVGKITVKGGQVSASANFTIQLADYSIHIGAGAKSNISENIELTVSGNYEKKA